MNGTDESGITRITSHHPVTTTLERLESLPKERGVMVFARIDFSGDAARAGLTMRLEQMLIFGNPKAGTPLMQAIPAVGLDLPLKALAWAGRGRADAGRLQRPAVHHPPSRPRCRIRREPRCGGAAHRAGGERVSAARAPRRQ